MCQLTQPIVRISTGSGSGWGQSGTHTPSTPRHRPGRRLPEEVLRLELLQMQFEQRPRQVELPTQQVKTGNWHPADPVSRARARNHGEPLQVECRPESAVEAR